MDRINSRQRLWIVGPCGSGKSTLADRLGALLNIPVHHLDAIHWKPGWVEADPAEEIARVGELVRGDAWIVDGNYSHLRAPHRHRIELLIRLDYPLSITFPRLLHRTVRRSIQREVICNGNRESLRRALCSSESILWWSLSTHHQHRAAIERELHEPPHIPHLHLRHPREADAMIAGMRD